MPMPMASSSVPVRCFDGPGCEQHARQESPSHRERGESFHDIGFRTDNFLDSCRLLLLPTAVAAAMLLPCLRPLVLPALVAAASVTPFKSSINCA